MKRQGLLVVWMLAVGSAYAGDIVGRVRGQGKQWNDAAPREKYDSRRFQFMERMDYGNLRDFIVYVDGPVPATQAPTGGVERVVTHSHGEFVPHVMPIMVGTTIAWPNKDDIHHNAFSFSEAKAFDLGLYKDEVRHVLFDKPGRVDVFCSIHTAMHCIVLVLEHPFFSTTDEKGRYQIRDLPAGKYRLKAWHERLPSQVKEVVAPDRGAVRVDFTLSVDELPPY